jgi:type I restriction enzyme M protein
VPADEIRDNAYDLSLGRYYVPKYEAEQHEQPKVILARMKKLEDEVQGDLIELEGMLGD